MVDLMPEVRDDKSMSARTTTLVSGAIATTSPRPSARQGWCLRLSPRTEVPRRSAWSVWCRTRAWAFLFCFYLTQVISAHFWTGLLKHEEWLVVILSSSYCSHQDCWLHSLHVNGYCWFHALIWVCSFSFQNLDQAFEIINNCLRRKYHLWHWGPFQIRCLDGSCWRHISHNFPKWQCV